MSDEADATGDTWDDEERLGALRLMVRLLRRGSADPAAFDAKLAGLLAEELADALGYDSAQARAEVVAACARHRARPPEAKA